MHTEEAPLQEGGLREQATQATQAARRLRELQAAGSLGEAPLEAESL